MIEANMLLVACLLLSSLLFPEVLTNSRRDDIRSLREKGQNWQSRGIFRDSSQTLKAFDSNNDGKLNPREFGALCKSLFRNSTGEAYRLETGMVEQLFRIFDDNSDGELSSREFQFCFDNWARKILNPVSVLVVVDVQKDFIDGSIALRNGPARQEGKDVVAPINKMVDSIPFHQVFYTKDWHPPDHISFFDNLNLWGLHESSPIRNPRDVRMFDEVVLRGLQGQPVEQRLWPRHCVWDTWGAELDGDLKIRNGSKLVTKGMDSNVDSYSAFMDNDKRKFTALKGYLDEIGATDAYVVGLAYDVCVKATVEDSLSLGYRTVLVEDATRGIYPEGIRRTRENILRMGGAIVQSGDVSDMIQGRDRRPELGLYLAKQISNSQKLM